MMSLRTLHHSSRPWRATSIWNPAPSSTSTSTTIAPPPNSSGASSYPAPNAPPYMSWTQFAATSCRAYRRYITPSASPLWPSLTGRRPWSPTPITLLRQGWIKPVFFVIILVFFCFFFVFLYVCTEERVFRVFSVSRILLGASRLQIIITLTNYFFLLIYASALD
jgi:hypothetical protein